MHAETDPLRGRVRASVVMATYNGAEFLDEQLSSIVDQLAVNDELVVVDDCSTDQTLLILERYRDPQLRVLRNKTNVGHVATFELGIAAARGDVVVLSDQDDVWAPGRLELLVDACRQAPVVASSLRTLDDQTCGGWVGFPDKRRVAPSRVLMALLTGRGPYFGSTMAFSRVVKDVLLPFPSAVQAHDLWLAEVGALYGGPLVLPDVTVLRRVHGANLTPRKRRRLDLVLSTRVRLLVCLFIGINRRARAGGPRRRRTERHSA